MARLAGGGRCVLPLAFFLVQFCVATEIPPSVQQVPTITKQSKVQVAFPFDEYFQLECEAKGNPEPTFTWTKDDKPFHLSDPRITVSDNSGTFKISNEGHVSHFQGKYRCFASNKLGVAMSEEIEFIVPNVPKFPKEKIEPLEVEEGDAVVLPCRPPKGLPPLHIYWMNIGEYCSVPCPPSCQTASRTQDEKPPNSIKQRKPSLLLPPAERGPESAVTVLQGDALLLECFAEGLFQAVAETEVRLDRSVGCDSVSGESPFAGDIISPSEVSFTNLQPNHTAVYQCEAANVHGTILASANVDVVESPFAGDIISPSEVSFTNLQPNHTAVYQCEAANVHGTILASANVDVVDVRPLIQTEDDVTYAAVAGASVSLHCKFFASPEATVSWVTVDGANLTVSNVTVEDEGVYACSAQTALDSVTEETRVTVLEYIIEFEGNKVDPGRWEELARVRGEETTALLPLAPYVTYQFRVSAVNEVGRGQPSRPSDRHETPPAAPDRNPQNIRVQASQPKEMIIKWEPRHESVLDTLFQLQKRRLTGGVTVPARTQRSQRSGVGRVTVPCRRARGVAVFGLSDAHPDAAPEIRGVDVINSTLAKVTWSAVPKDSVRGHLRGYEINWWKTKSLLDGRTLPKRVNVLRFSGPRNSGMLPSLEAFSEFHVTVSAYNSRGAGPESEPHAFRTPEGVPGQPAFLKVVQIDKDTATVSWGLPQKLNGNLTGYVLQYQIINDTYEVGELNAVNITSPSKPSWHLSNLSPATRYKFYVRACTSRGCGKPLTEESLTAGDGSKGLGKLSGGVNLTQKLHPVEVFEPGADHVVRLSTKNWVDNSSIFEDVIEARGRGYAGLYDDIATQGWFIGLMCAVAVLTLTLLTVCFVKRNRGGKYSVKEKEDLHPDPEVQSGKDETFGDYSDSDEKPLKGSVRSLARGTEATGSADSLVAYGEGDHGLFSEDGSFIGAYAGRGEKGPGDSGGSVPVPFPPRA
ncbi:neural cell adhesion molecule L1-like protein [Pteropus vampyrus]|uniref:Neural cell adhesion molecule L1-like protein n=1 Tax=Pteropus vampyrus TaxID=132908 RepID=A0A6P3RZ03_PTEVA|nr:neural cell adhesion molecule L1-like protein [Pteropus vampyrus]